MTWRSLGPSNIGGCMLGVAIDFSSNSRLYAAAASGGCWHLDYTVSAFPPAMTIGTQWAPLTDQQPLLYTTAVATCRRHPQTVYYATGHYNLPWPAQVWRSDDRGANWLLPNQFDFGLIYRMIADPDDAMRVYLASTSGLWGTSTGGSAWNRLYTGNVWDVAMDPDDPAIVYAAIEGVGLIKTTNARPHRPLDFIPFWRRVLPWSFMPLPSMIRIGLGGQGDPNHRVVALKFEEEVWRHPHSAEDVQAWESKGKPGFSDPNSGQGSWDHVIAIDPFDDRVILAGAQDLYRTNGESEWQKVAGYGTETHSDQQQVIFDPAQPGVVYLANDGGVWSSRDSGATWFSLNGGLVTAELFHSGLSGGTVMATMYHEGLIGSTAVQTTNWSVLEGGSWEFSGAFGDPRRSGRFYIFKDTLGLRRFLVVPVGVLNAFDTDVGDFVPRSIDFDMRSNSNTIVVGTDDGRVMRALDGDSLTPTWTTEPGIPGGQAITGIAFEPGGPKLQFGRHRVTKHGVWAVDRSGALYSKPDINDNVPWQHRGTSKITTDAIRFRGPLGQGSQIEEVKGLGVDAESSACVYLLRWTGIEMTPDGGASWSTINGTGPDTLPPKGLISIFPHPTQGSTLLVASSAGLYVSLDRGSHWHLFGEGLPTAPISQAFMAAGHLYVCTIGRGLWWRDISHWGSYLMGPLRTTIAEVGPHISG